MEYTYRIMSSGGKHLAEKDIKERPAGGRIAGRLIVCFALAAAALTAKFAFPAQTAVFFARFGVGGSYREAAETIGQAISGEKTFGDAVAEAYSIAFGGKPDGEEASVKNVPREEPEYEYRRTETKIETPPAESVTAEVIPTDGEAYDEAVAEAFAESQSKYEEYGVPANVTYGMPAIEADLICPAAGGVSSGFGYRSHPSDGKVRFHYGTDVAAPTGTEITAAADGKVKAVGNSSSYGKYVMVDHGGVVTMYAHCSEVYVSDGDGVLKGDRIAAVGETGNATGPCLHFEVIVDGTYVNPEFYVSWS